MPGSNRKMRGPDNVPIFRLVLGYRCQSGKAAEWKNGWRK